MIKALDHFSATHVRISQGPSFVHLRKHETLSASLKFSTCWLPDVNPEGERPMQQLGGAPGKLGSPEHY